MKKILASIYLFVGLITAILDSLDILKLGIMGFQTSLCNGDINCSTDGISKMILFFVDIVVGPAILAAKIASYPELGIIGALIAAAIIWFAYGRK